MGGILAPWVFPQTAGQELKSKCLTGEAADTPHVNDACRALPGAGHPPVYMDLASLGALPKYTCGQLYYFAAFSPKRDGQRLAHDVRHNLTRPTAWEVRLFWRHPAKPSDAPAACPVCRMQGQCARCRRSHRRPLPADLADQNVGSVGHLEGMLWRCLQGIGVFELEFYGWCRRR